MAIFTSALAASNQVFTGPGGGVVFVREFTYPVTGSLALNDVIQMIPVFKGERVVDLQLIAEDIDSATTLVLDVGDGDDTDRYIDGATIGQAGGVARYGQGIDTDAEVVALTKTYTVADTIDVLVQVAATAVAGTITLRAFLVRS